MPKCEICGKETKKGRLKQILEVMPNLPLYILDGIGYKMLGNKFEKMILNWETSTSKQEVMPK